MSITEIDLNVKNLIISYEFIENLLLQCEHFSCHEINYQKVSCAKHLFNISISINT